MPRVAKAKKMTVADFKRKLTAGTVLTMVDFHGTPVSKRRVVLGTASGYAKLGGDGIREGEYSMLNWPKAAELTETPDGFIVAYGDSAKNGCGIRYVWGEVVAETEKE